MNPFIHALFASNQDPLEIFDLGESLSYTWFGRPNYAWDIASGKYWFGSTKDIEGGTTQHVTEYDKNTQVYTTTRVGTIFQKNDHNQTQILIRNSDSRLIAFYVEHNGAALRYKISTNPLDSTSWGSEFTLNPHSAYSYISPYQSSNGDIFIFFRVKPVATAVWYYMKSTDGGLTFGPAIAFYENGSTQNYLISVQNGNFVHFTASNGHPQTNSGININVYHFYFDMLNETLHTSNGTTITAPLDIADITLAASTSGNDTSWILDITCKNNFPRIIYCLYPNGRTNNTPTKELWFVEWGGSSWINNQKISETMIGYIEDDASIQEYAYDSASRFDVQNPDIIWMPKDVNGVLELHKVDIRESPVLIEQLTFDSSSDNWRPISVVSTENNLLWMVKNSYNMFTDYDMNMATLTVGVD